MGIQFFKTDNRVYETHHWHTYEPSHISKDGWALDLGCNDFIMSKHLLSLGLKVIGIDPIDNISIPSDLKNNPNFIYLQKACVGIKNNPTATYYEYSHWGANSLYNPPEKLHREINGGHGNNPFKVKYDVPLITLQELMDEYNIQQFEYIKIDTEGAEYEILENLPTKCSKQISVEFHAFLDLTPSNDVEEYHKILNLKLSDYFVSYEQLEPLRGFENYWQRDDTLYVLKDLL
jgi:FkbM family methyltransferase